ncbi:MAG: hypothetical protein HXS47_12085 [Theionarchaea archaeon]|nr:hypothetical protein [Theionarchaea archaeon]
MYEKFFEKIKQGEDIAGAFTGDYQMILLVSLGVLVLFRFFASTRFAMAAAFIALLVVLRALPLVFKVSKEHSDTFDSMLFYFALTIGLVIILLGGI